MRITEDRRARWRRRAICAGVTCLLAASASLAEENPAWSPAEVRKVWSSERYSAFTDLIHFGDRFLCTFREGADHASPAGTIRVIASPDGVAWASVAELTSDEYDLRDPKLCVTPDGRLMMNGGATSYGHDDRGQPVALARHSFVSFSSDGETWSPPRIITRTEEDLWLWRVTWHDGVAYGAGKTYRDALWLMSSTDGVQFTRHTPALLTDNWPNEATLRFDDAGTAYLIVRREGEMVDGRWTREPAFLGVSSPPYEMWAWRDTGVYLGGPNMIELPDGRWIVGARTRLGPARMSLLQLDPDTGTLTLLTHLPSGGDCSYPGMVWRDGTLWVSYYSSHEDHSAIYLARFEEIPQ